MAVYSSLAYKAKKSFELLTMTFLSRKEGKHYFILEIWHPSFFVGALNYCYWRFFYFSLMKGLLGGRKKSPF